MSEVPSFVLHYGSLLWTSQPPIHMTTGNLNDSGYSFKFYLLHYLYWIRRTFVLWLYSCPKLPTYYAHEICTYHFLVRMGRKRQAEVHPVLTKRILPYVIERQSTTIGSFMLSLFSFSETIILMQSLPNPYIISLYSYYTETAGCVGHLKPSSSSTHLSASSSGRGSLCETMVSVQRIMLFLPSLQFTLPLSFSSVLLTSTPLLSIKCISLLTLSLSFFLSLVKISLFLFFS